MHRSLRSPGPRAVFVGTLIVFAMALSSSARADYAVPSPHDSYTEPQRFTVRNLRLGDGGSTVALPAGGRIEGALDVMLHCPSCSRAVNQIIVGLAGEPQAQACVYSGGARTNGFRTTRFALNVPDRPGTYEVRVRYAQAWDCNKALGWWRVNRPQGPGPESTIGFVTVQGPRDPVPGPGRGVQAVRDEIEGRLRWIEQQAQAFRASNWQLASQLGAQADAIRRLQDELVEAARREHRGRGWNQSPPPGGWQPTLPRPLSPPEFQSLVDMLREEGFERYRIGRLRDSLRAGAHLTVSQAVTLLDEFDFANSKEQAAELICLGGMAEPGALPKLLAALPREGLREQLRRATGGRCEP